MGTFCTRNHAVKIEWGHRTSRCQYANMLIDFRIWNCRYAWVAADAQSQYAGFRSAGDFFLVSWDLQLPIIRQTEEMLYIG